MKRYRIGTDPAKIADIASCYAPFGLVCSGWGTASTAFPNNREGAAQEARYRSAGISGTSVDWSVNWRTQAITWTSTGSGNSEASPTTVGWTNGAVILARSSCAARNLDYVEGSADFGPGHSNNNGASDGPARDTGDNLGWFLDSLAHSGGPTYWQYQAQQSRSWTALCKKVVRRSR